MNTLNRITLSALLAIFGFSGLACNSALAQVPVDENGIPIESVTADVNTVAADVDTPVLLSVDELEQIVGPVALYPDELLAIVLPASTYPIQIVLAARFLDDLEADGTLKPDETWDDSIIALLNYPEVVRKMSADLDWTTQLGDAVLDQQADVIAAVEQFRDRAYAAGNLKTDDHQVVKSDDGIIEITPVEEDVIYVPYYEPERVIVYQAAPAYYYYPRPYPVYYYPYADDYYFASGFFWGVTSAYHLSWHSHYLSVYHHSYHGHPYYGRDYGYHYYRRPDVNVYVNNYYGNNRSHNYSNRDRDGDRWQADSRNYQDGRNRRNHSDRERRREANGNSIDSRRAANLSRERQREPGRDSVDRSRLRTMADPDNAVSRRSAGSAASSSFTAESGNTGRTRPARSDNAFRERPAANNQAERNATTSGTSTRRPVRRQTDVPATAFRQRATRGDAAISSDLTKNAAPTRTTERRASQSRRTDSQRTGLVQSDTRNPVAAPQRRSSSRQVERPTVAPQARTQARTRTSSNASTTQPRNTAVTRQAAPRSTPRPTSQVQRTQRQAPVSSSRPTPTPRAAPAPRSTRSASPQAKPAPAVTAKKERRQKSRQKD